MATFTELKKWFEEDLGHFADWNKDVHQIVGNEIKKGRLYNRFYIYTNINCYQVLAIEDDKGGYLGCQVSTRKQRAGENWSRGRDLPDGKLTRDTWNRILSGIVSYELVKIHKLKVDCGTSQ